MSDERKRLIKAVDKAEDELNMAYVALDVYDEEHPEEAKE